jgi:excinuclease UvrABC nuclease subunit
MPIRAHLQNADNKNLENAPDERGVYALYDAGQNLIYYGAAESSIRDGLKGYLAGNANSFTPAACYFNYELSDYPFLREEQLLAEYEKAKKRLPEYNHKSGGPKIVSDNYLETPVFKAFFNFFQKISPYFQLFRESQ